MTFWKTACLALAVGVCSPIVAEACDCRGPATCEPFRAHDATFVGTVLSRRIVQQGEMVGAYKVEQTEYLVRVRVVERFTGPAVGQEVLVTTGLGDGDCGYEFDVGRQYVIDASAKDGMLFTSLCTLTSLATSNSVILRELRSNAAGRRSPDVSGTVVQEGLPLKWGEQKPLSGIRVSLRSTAGPVSLQTVTDSDGTYSFDNVPSGTYRVSVDGLPTNLAVSGSNLQPYFTDDIGELRVPGHLAASAACHLEISAAPSGRISGNIIASKKILSDADVEAYSLGNNEQKGELICSRAPKENGEFRLPYLPAGRYRVVFRRGSKLTGPSINVNLADGEQKGLGEIRLR